MLGAMDVGALRTNLIIHHRITDILGQAAKLVYIFSAVQESRDLPPFFQRDEVLENLVQFPGKSYTSDCLSRLKGVGLPFKDRPPPFLLGLTFGNRRTE
jgi:hypothetical protein